MPDYFPTPQRANFLFQRAFKALARGIAQNWLFGLLAMCFSMAIIVFPIGYYPLTKFSVLAYLAVFPIIYLWLCLFYRSYFLLGGAPVSFAITLKNVGKKYGWCLITFILALIIMLVASRIGWWLLTIFFAHVLMTSHVARFGIVFFALPFLYAACMVFYALHFTLIENLNPLRSIQASAHIAYRKIYAAFLPMVFTLLAFVVYYGILHMAAKWGHPILYSIAMCLAVGLIGLPYLANFCNLMFEDLKLRRNQYDKKVGKNPEF